MQGTNTDQTATIRADGEIIHRLRMASKSILKFELYDICHCGCDAVSTKKRKRNYPRDTTQVLLYPQVASLSLRVSVESDDFLLSPNKQKRIFGFCSSRRFG